MNLPRVSIAKLMVIVGVVALNIAASRAFLNWEWTGLFLIGLALQVGLLCSIRGRIGFRPFWWGFEAFGLASAIATTLIASISPYGFNQYLTSAFLLVEHLCTLVKNPVSQARLIQFLFEDNQLLILEIVIFLPELLIAVVGGLFANLFIQSQRRHPPGA